jgi:hypothetical protein
VAILPLLFFCDYRYFVIITITFIAIFCLPIFYDYRYFAIIAILEVSHFEIMAIL